MLAHSKSHLPLLLHYYFTLQVIRYWLKFTWDSIFQDLRRIRVSCVCLFGLVFFQHQLACSVLVSCLGFRWKVFWKSLRRLDTLLPSEGAPVAEHAHPAPLEVTQLKRLWRWGPRLPIPSRSYFLPQAGKFIFLLKARKNFKRTGLKYNWFSQLGTAWVQLCEIKT